MSQYYLTLGIADLPLLNLLALDDTPYCLQETKPPTEIGKIVAQCRHFCKGAFALTLVDKIATLKQQKLTAKVNALSSTAGFSPGLTESWCLSRN